MSASLSSVTQTRSALARLYANQPNPEEAVASLARANLACAKIDNRIREYIRAADTNLNETHIAHLVGLLLSGAGVGGEAVTLLERAVYEAAAAAQDRAVGGGQ